MQQNYNKKNKGLALLGHSKLKAILPFTLLLIGLLVCMNGAWAQDQIPEALKLDKKFYPDDPMGHSGKLWLETYTTGTVTQIQTEIPTDIVLVLDASASMTSNNMTYEGGSVTRLRALQMAVREFIATIYNDADQHECDHRIAVVSFSTENNIRLLSIPGTPSGHTVTSFTTGDYQNALVPVRQYESLTALQNSDRLGNGLTGSSSNWNTGRIYNATGTGTAMHGGLQAALGILNARAAANGGGVYFTPEGTTTQLPRNMVVVFFTDGYPGNQNHSSTLWWPQSLTANGNVTGWANQAVAQASAIKSISVAPPSGGEASIPTIYSIGVTSGADPAANYTTQRGNNQGNPTNNGTYWVTGTKCFNALLHFISSDYDKTIDTWVGPAQNEAYGGTLTNGGPTGEPGINPGYYKAANNASELSAIFQSIASSSGGTPINLGSNAVVQDVISASFKLPEGATVNSIKVYAPLLKRGRDVVGNQGMTRKNADSPWEYHFEDTVSGGNNYAGRLVLDTETGHITDSTYENRINSNLVVSIDPDDPKKISFTHFDFSHYYCGPVINGHDTTGYVGRKLVMIIPIEIEEGTWGDGIETNDELSFVTPDNEIHWQFPIPGATVVGDVWTEIITKQPAGYADDDINSPEDLAWFISRVNGRAGYLNDNNVASNTSLSGKLTADIDMSAHNWVPIGAGYKCNAQGQYVDANNNPVYDIDPVTNEPRLDINGNPITLPTVNLAYEGVFDGNGHVITGLKNNATKYYKLAHAEDYQVLVYPGMFSNVKGNGTTSGVVKNVFVLGSDFRARNHERDMETFIHFGIIADTLTGGAIYNCEAVGSINCNNDYLIPTTHEIDYIQIGRDAEMILGGLVGLNVGGTIHSSMAMAELTGFNMGGMVGEMRNNGSTAPKVANGFTNGVYNYLGTRDGLTWDQATNPHGLFRYVGGLVGTQKAGTVENCYVRFERPNSYGTVGVTNSIQFGQFVGFKSSGTVEKCYYPYDNTIQLVGDNGSVAENCDHYSYPTSPSLMRYYRSNDNMVGGTLVAHQYEIAGTQTTVYLWEGGTTLVDVLNDNLESGYAEWKRTTAGNYATSLNGGNINGDFPVLKFADYTTIASTNGIAIDYAKTLDQMLTRHNTGNLNVGTAIPYDEEDGYHGMPTHNYHVTGSSAIYGGTINLYANDNTSMSTTANTVVYIDEDVSLLQDAGSTITAYTGQHIIDYGSTSDPQSGNRWHNVSSSLSNSMFGWYYRNEEPVPFSWTDSNPCGLRTNSADDDTELFPTDMGSTHPFDFYCFYEPQYHWINFKRASDSHWHMDLINDSGDPDDPDNHAPISYSNENHFIPGKGYLLALHTEYFDDMHFWTESDYAMKDRTFLQNRGTLNNGVITIPVTYTADNEWTGLAGYNLLGNPYQSFLDFDAFANAEANANLWEGSKYARTFAVFDPSDVTTTGARGGSYVQYAATASQGAKVAGPTINMHQGFFIQVAKDGTATFNNDMRTNDATPNFRGERPAYPLINFTLTDNEGQTDVAVLELNRPENDGAKKLRLGDPAGRIYFNYDDEQLAIYFRNSDKDYQSLCFAADEDGNFTLDWNTANANFSSLTLVDNITGVKTDMLTHDHYTFQGRVSDYNTRFKILFGAFTDVEEQEETLDETFAFFNDDNLIVNGTGHLDVIDVLGRVIYATELADTQNTVSLPANFKGVGVLRISNGSQVKVQKIIIK